MNIITKYSSDTFLNSLNVPILHGLRDCKLIFKLMFSCTNVMYVCGPSRLVVSLGKKRHVVRYTWCLPVNVSAMLTSFNINSLKNALSSFTV